MKSADFNKRRARQLQRAYELMRAHFGHQRWWPGETAFEVCVGAILTQNTSWSNVERALANLKAAQVLNPLALYELPEERLADLIRPAGYFNVKARRLRSFLSLLLDQFGGELVRLFDGETPEVRQRLLAVKGIGPETADSMLLYAGGHLSFVIDAYAKRIFYRHDWCTKEAAYSDLKELCESSLNRAPPSRRLDYWQDYHAQLVMIGKHFCHARGPLCNRCPLKPLLPSPSRLFCRA